MLGGGGETGGVWPGLTVYINPRGQGRSRSWSHPVGCWLVIPGAQHQAHNTRSSGLGSEQPTRRTHSPAPRVPLVTQSRHVTYSSGVPRRRKQPDVQHRPKNTSALCTCGCHPEHPNRCARKKKKNIRGGRGAEPQSPRARTQCPYHLPGAKHEARPGAPGTERWGRLHGR